MKGLKRVVELAEMGRAMPLMSFPGVQLLGIPVGEVLQSATKQAQCMAAVAERFDCAAAVSLMDLSIEAEAFGSEVCFSDDEVPTVVGAVVTTESEARALVVPEVGSGRSGLCIEAVREAKGVVRDRPLLAGVIGPFSLAGRLMDMNEIMIKSLLEPAETHIVVEKCTEFIVAYAAAFKDAGADGLVVAEPAAGLLSPELFEEFSCRYVRRIIGEVQGEGFGVVYHNCGNTLPLMGLIAKLGAEAYHFGDAVDIGDVLREMPRDLTVMGNLSPAVHLRGGTPESVRVATMEMLGRAAGYENYIASSGCDVPPLTPLENIDAFLGVVSEELGDMN